MINALIIDDQALMRFGIKTLLTNIKDINVLGEAVNSEDALRFAQQNKPDLILLELMIPGVGGLEILRKLKHVAPEAKIVVITACEEVAILYHAMKLGVLGYVTKTANTSEILTAIQKALTEKSYISMAIAQRMAMKQTMKNAETPLVELSQREMQVIWMIINGHSIREIAEKLFLSPKTINTYRYRSFQKLGVKNNVELTHFALQHGMLKQVLACNEISSSLSRDEDVSVAS